jgi:hypothetical protein
VSSATYFSNLLEEKDRRLKIKLTLSLILRVNLRLRGYSKIKLTLSLILRVNLRLGDYFIWSASLIAPPYKEYWTTTRGMSTSQPRRGQGSTRRHLQDTVRRNSKTPSEVLGRLHYSATKSLGACQTRVYGTAHVAHFSYNTGWDMARVLHLL